MRDEEFCTYLTVEIRLRTWDFNFNCCCLEATSANCIKDGVCPIYYERLKKIEEISKNYDKL